MDGEEAVDTFEGGVRDGEIAAEVGAVEEPAGEGEEEMHVRGAFGGKFGTFKEDRGAGDICLGMAAGAAGPIDDDGPAWREEDVVGMKIGVANGGTIGKEGEGSFGSAALLRCAVLGESEPVFELLALGGEFRRSGESMDLGVEIRQEARGVKQFPGLAFDKLEEGRAFNALENNSGAAFDLDQVIGRGNGTTRSVQRASDSEFEFRFGRWKAREEQFEDTTLFPGENLGGESFADKFAWECDRGVQGNENSTAMIVNKQYAWEQ